MKRPKRDERDAVIVNGKPRIGHPIMSAQQRRRVDWRPRHTLLLSTDELFALREAAYLVLHRPWGFRRSGLDNAVTKLQLAIAAYEDELPK